MSMDFGQEMAKIAAMVEPDDAQVHPDSIAVAVDVLHDIDERYGPDSDNPLEHHNAEHGLDVARRVTLLNNIIYPYVPPRYQPQLFDLGLVDGSGHDYEQGLGPGANEKASGCYLVGKVSALGVSPINTVEFKDRLYDGIQATEIEEGEDGRIIQVNVREGSQDPLRWSMSAGDINGVAIEGSARMFKDATRICYEKKAGDPSLDELYDFLISQAAFLRQRTNDRQVMADMAYYFPNDVADVYDDMKQAFRPNILSAYRVATLLGARPELKNTVGVAVKRSLGVLDRSLLGDLVGRAVELQLPRPASS
jgi:hypothetical protein